MYHPIGMKIVEDIALIDQNRYPWTEQSLDEVRAAIAMVRHPPGGPDFAIYPESGKKSRQGSGVGPIRKLFISAIEAFGWEQEAAFPLKTKSDDSSQLGKMDASKRFRGGPPFVVEWETGNISSSHRAMNKMCVGLQRGVLSGGVLVVPSAALSGYLTDRVGNVRELRPYLPFWKDTSLDRGYLGVIVVEHDRTDLAVERIVKGTDGRARS